MSLSQTEKEAPVFQFIKRNVALGVSILHFFQTKSIKGNSKETIVMESFETKASGKACSSLKSMTPWSFLPVSLLVQFEAVLHLALWFLSPASTQRDQGASCRGRSTGIFTPPIKSGKWPFKRRPLVAPWLREWPSERWTTRCHTWLSVKVCSTHWDHHHLWIAAGGSGWRLPGWESSALALTVCSSRAAEQWWELWLWPNGLMFVSVYVFNLNRDTELLLQLLLMYIVKHFSQIQYIHLCTKYSYFSFSFFYLFFSFLSHLNRL